MDELNLAIPIYLKWGTSPFPKENTDGLIEKFGPEKAKYLNNQISNILSKLKQMEPDWQKHSLTTASHWAVSQLENTYPYLDEESTTALEWVYSWWWK